MNETMSNIISNCMLCEEHSLHVMNQNELKLMQCIHCGYASTDKFLGTKEDNEEYQKLTDDMKEWSIETGGRIWTPAMMTLPMGMLYPFNDKEKNMKWGYAKMIDIPEEKQKNYPAPNGQFYTKTYDVDNTKIYDTFFDAMLEINKKSKTPEIKLPKLKKIDGKK